MERFLLLISALRIARLESFHLNELSIKVMVVADFFGITYEVLMSLLCDVSLYSLKFFCRDFPSSVAFLQCLQCYVTTLGGPVRNLFPAAV